ncbi:MAG: glycosyltransferase family 4 protein [Aeriscardovia sp.]|nr:glycosyltransferase family 4 protein [Aeriscardovia sp.]
MKKILLITESLGSGGAERQMVGLAALLKLRGYDVTVVTYLKRQFYESYLHERQVKYIFAPQLLRKSTRIYQLVKFFNHMKPDVVISYLPQVNQSVCLSRLFTRFRLIVSERSHTLHFDWRARIRFYSYKIADYIVTNSFSEAENIANHFFSLKHKIFAIPNFVDTKKFTPFDAVDKERSTLNILTIGRVIEQKNVLRYIEAIAELRNEGYTFRCKWVGAMYDKEYVDSVMTCIKKNQIEDLITFCGQTDDVISQYQEADIFCLPSLVEGYPNVLVEAMSCGLIVACSNVFENPKIVSESINGYLFNPEDKDSIKNALRKCLVLNENTRRNIGCHNRQQVIQNNSEEKFVEQYIRLLS